MFSVEYPSRFTLLSVTAQVAATDIDGRVVLHVVHGHMASDAVPVSTSTVAFDRKGSVTFWPRADLEAGLYTLYLHARDARIVRISYDGAARATEGMTVSEGASSEPPPDDPFCQDVPDGCAVISGRMPQGSFSFSPI